MSWLCWCSLFIRRQTLSRNRRYLSVITASDNTYWLFSEADSESFRLIRSSGIHQSKTSESLLIEQKGRAVRRIHGQVAGGRRQDRCDSEASESVRFEFVELIIQIKRAQRRAQTEHFEPSCALPFSAHSCLFVLLSIKITPNHFAFRFSIVTRQYSYCTLSDRCEEKMEGERHQSSH